MGDAAIVVVVGLIPAPEEADSPALLVSEGGVVALPARVVEGATVVLLVGCSDVEVVGPVELSEMMMLLSEEGSVVLV